MSDKHLHSLIRKASEAQAGSAPRLRRIQSRSQCHPPMKWGAWATAVSACLVLALGLMISITSTVEREETILEPDLFVLPDPLERSDWLAYVSSQDVMGPSRSDWLLAGMPPHDSPFLTDGLVADQSPAFDAFVLVDRSGAPLSDPEFTNTVYVIERTLP